MTTTTSPLPGRLQSLDLFRGLTMFFLMGEAAGLYHAGSEATVSGGILHALVEQFHHHPWHGLRFWDLIQPFFMFIVGVAMPYSYHSRQKKGQSEAQIRRHILLRCAWLLLFGVGLHCVYNHEIVWELWNVLTQLSFTILLTFFVMKLPLRAQLGISIALLLLTEVLYRGYDPTAPFVKDQNFGSWMDLILMGKINPGGGWVAVNCIPTAAHTIWGAMAAQLLRSGASGREIMQKLLIAGVVALLLGYGLDWLNITPIVKRIATSSFVLASGGWALLGLALAFWWVDLRGKNRGIWFFTVVGMNSIFIYLFIETVGHQWVRGFAATFTTDPLSGLGMGAAGIGVISALLTLGIFWYLCVFLYQKRIFFKI